MGQIRTFFRMIRTGWVMARHDALVPKEYASSVPPPVRAIGGLSRIFALKGRADNPGERFAAALEALGPAYIKFGQILSTRGDMLDPVFVKGLSRLKDNVPSFPMETAEEMLAAEWGSPWGEHLLSLSAPIAAASVAQVHKGVLKNKDGSAGAQVAVKILRPNINRQMKEDMDVLSMVAGLAERFVPDTRRLGPAEFISTARRAVMLELDLRLEAAACSELSEPAAETGYFRVPNIHWELGGKNILVTDWVDGMALSDDKILSDPNYDPKDIARRVMQSFLACAFDYGVFHADMHEGNMIAAPKTGPKDAPKTTNGGGGGELTLIDFGILGRLEPHEQRFHAEILYGFLRRDYRRIAEIHFEAGYVPKDHSVDDFAGALRAVGEPIFGKRAEDVPMSKVLLQLFEITEIFDMKMQPQLIMLQKTMMQAEGVCRRLDPEFDMWETARPIVEASMRRELGLEGRIGDFLDNVDRARRTFETLPDAAENIAKLANAWAQGDIDLSSGLRAAHTNTAPARQSALKSSPLRPLWFVGLGAALAVCGVYAAAQF